MTLDEGYNLIMVKKKLSYSDIKQLLNLRQGYPVLNDELASLKLLCDEWIKTHVARWTGIQLNSLGGKLLARVSYFPGSRSDFCDFEVYIPNSTEEFDSVYVYFKTEKKALAYAEKHAKRLGFHVENSEVSAKKR